MALSPSQRALAYARLPDADDELPEPTPEDTEPDYPSDATTRILRMDLVIERPVKPLRDNSHLLPSVIVEPDASDARPMKVALAPASHVRTVDPARPRATESGPWARPPAKAPVTIPRIPNLALMALLVSIGVFAPRMLPVLGRWVESMLSR